MGIFGRKKAPEPDPAVVKAQAQQEQRAETQTQQEQQQLAARRNVRRTGGMRLLFSPLAQGQRTQDQLKQTLGG